MVFDTATTTWMRAVKIDLDPATEKLRAEIRAEVDALVPGSAGAARRRHRRGRLAAAAPAAPWAAPRPRSSRSWARFFRAGPTGSRRPVPSTPTDRGVGDSQPRRRLRGELIRQPWLAPDQFAAERRQESLLLLLGSVGDDRYGISQAAIPILGRLTRPAENSWGRRMSMSAASGSAAGAWAGRPWPAPCRPWPVCRVRR